MRAAVLLAVALAGCGDRRSFDERYQDTQRNLQQRSHDLDAAINETDSVAPANSTPT
ncbi:MAG: hypothetical protein AVDCRST_MAG44-317 [uncultured Sphingomonas sp.]|uniref:Lipoprotein n=1 Tax=uncultured Sphingomonas sp. TaxID=158754 RepID=A0A6J4SDJ3_9SPHN|nr:MAG: hypothetical protein AVDCRST_MAG44-317 [uncultured Sphingomonas sp.]